MNDQLQEQLAEMLGRLTTFAGEATDWTISQAYPLIQEKILFGRIFETTLLIGFMLITLGLVLTIRFCENKRKHQSYGECWELGVGVSAMTALVSTIAFAAQIYSVILVWAAPRLYIVEWLAGLVRKD